MNKQEWENLYRTLDNIHSDFLLSYPTYKNGKNKKIRDDAERKVESAIRQADFHIKKNLESFELLTGGKESSDFSRAVIYDEFILPHYFGNDLNDYLKKIREKINTITQV